MTGELFTTTHSMSAAARWFPSIAAASAQIRPLRDERGQRRGTAEGLRAQHARSVTMIKGGRS
jgi:hypothetical protein